MIGASVILAHLIFFSIIGIIILSLCTIIGIIILIEGIVKKRKYKNVPRSKKKKYPNVLIALGSIFICIPLLTGGVLITNAVANYINHEKKLTPEDKCEIIIDAVKNKDKEPIKELFCEKAKNTHDLDAELDEFFNHIDGNIISYDQPYQAGGGFSSNAEKGLVEKSVGGVVRNVRTDTDNLYIISFLSYDVYKDHPEFLGIVSISVRDQNRYNPDDYSTKKFLYRIDELPFQIGR